MLICSSPTNPGTGPANVGVTLEPPIETLTADAVALLIPVVKSMRKVGLLADPAGSGRSVPSGFSTDWKFTPSVVHTAAAVPCPLDLAEKMPGARLTTLTLPPRTELSEFVTMIIAWPTGMFGVRMLIWPVLVASN